jgi:hypothetical protein
MNRNFKNVAIHKSVHEQARFLSNITDRSIASITEELITKVFDIACTFENANLEFESCVTDGTVKISVVGRNRLSTSECKSPSVKEESLVSPIVRVKFKDTKGYVEIKPKGEKIG